MHIHIQGKNYLNLQYLKLVGQHLQPQFNEISLFLFLILHRALLFLNHHYN